MTLIRTLLEKGDKVRIRVTQPPRSNKLQHLPFSPEVGVIKEVRPETRSYVVEIQYPNRQPVQSLRHHRQVKKIIDRFEHLQHQSPRQQPEAENPEQPENPDREELDTEELDDYVVVNTRVGRTSRRPQYLADFEE